MQASPAPARRRRLGAKALAGAAALTATAGLALAGSPAAQATQTAADPYISVGDVVTNVGQHPHVVVRYGNRGGTTLNHVAYGCALISIDGSVVFRQTNYNTYRAPLLPGQSANFEFEGTARKVSDKTRVVCTIGGTDALTGAVRGDVDSATIRVKR
jgi:hypothetical protein